MNRPGSRSGGRPGSSAGRPGTGQKPAAVPPGTASRLATGMVPGTGSQRGNIQGGGVALSQQVQVADRPITQQGLGGMKTSAGRGLGKQQRLVYDKTYYLGVLRSKVNELTSELQRLTRENDAATEDQSSYVTYEKRAESLALEIKDCQAQLGDYNTLVEKLTTDENIGDMQMDYEDLKAQNDREERTLDALFEQKQEKEQIVRQLEVELQQERSMADNLVADMKPEVRQRYLQMKDTNEHFLKQHETGQQELDRLSSKKAELDEELAMSPVKQEAVRLYEQLHELEEKRDQLMAEVQSKSLPTEDREKLLKIVKDDNQEIATMERQTNEIRDKLGHLQEEIRQLDMDIEENQGERNQKYKELKKREESMNEFLDSFENVKASEIQKMQQLEQNIVLIMEHMSRNLARFHHLPTAAELANMREDLAFKDSEMGKSKTTASGLAGESEKLHQDLQKVEQLETKITTELDMLRSKIDSMENELVVYNDIDKLKSDSDTRKKKLGEDKVSLHKRRETLKRLVQHLTQQYEALKAQLNENETYAQLGNLERKWQHHEQNNFVMKDFIAAKTMECDFRILSKKVSGMVSEYNEELLKNISGKGSY